MRFRVYTHGVSKHCNSLDHDTVCRADKILDTQTGVWLKHRELANGSKYKSRRSPR